MKKRKYFCTCGSLETEKEETLKETTKLVMIRLSSLQRRKGRTRGHAGSLTPESQYHQTESNTPEKHRKSKSQVVQIDETKVADFRKCMQEDSRTYETMEGWDRIACGPQKIHKMTPQQRQARFGRKWHFVQSTAGGSNRRPTRQDPELGQADTTRMDCDSAQRVTSSQAGSSQSQP